MLDGVHSTSAEERARVRRLTNEELGHWLRGACLNHVPSQMWCLERGIQTVVKASGEAIDSTGGFLAPEELETTIRAFLTEEGIGARYATTINLGSDARTWPRSTDQADAQFVGEGVLIPEDDDVFDDLALTPKKIGVNTRFPSELYDDEAAALGEWYARRVAFSFAKLEDRCLFVGDGSGAYGGIQGVIPKLGNASKATAAAGHDGISKIDKDDVASMLALLPGYVRRRARIFVADDSCFMRMPMPGLSAIPTPAAPPPSFAQRTGPAGPASERMYGAYPVTIVPAMQITGSQAGQVIMLAGDLAQAAVIGRRRGTMLRTSTQKYFDRDQVVARATERLDIAVDNVGDENIAGAVVGLVAAA